MSIGVSQESREEAQRGSRTGDYLDKEDMILFKDYGRKYRFRIVEGVRRKASIWYETVYRTDNGDLQFGPRSFVVPEDDDGQIDSSFRDVIDFDRELAASVLGEKNPRSSLFPNRRYLYLAFDRDKFGKEGYRPHIKLVQAPKSVFDQINDLVTQTDIENDNLLLYGPEFSWDQIVIKNQEPGKSKQFGTKYHVSPYNVDKPSGFPVGFRYNGTDPVSDGYFTAEEWEAYKSCDIELEEQSKSLTDDEIKEFLARSPIYLRSKDNNGTLKYPDPEALGEKLQEMGFNCVLDPSDLIDSSPSREAKPTGGDTSGSWSE